MKTPSDLPPGVSVFNEHINPTDESPLNDDVADKQREQQGDKHAAPPSVQYTSAKNAAELEAHLNTQRGLDVLIECDELRQLLDTRRDLLAALKSIAEQEGIVSALLWREEFK